MARFCVAAGIAIAGLTGCGSSASDGAGAQSNAASVPAVEWKSVIRDAYDGVVEHPHSCAAVVAAISHLPHDRNSGLGVPDNLRRYRDIVCAAGVSARTVEMTKVPSNQGLALDQALRRLHSAGLRASFPEVTMPCGNWLPRVAVQTPRAPAQVRRGTTVTIRFAPSFVPSPVAPKHHEKYATVPNLVGLEAAVALAKLTTMWPCVRVAAANATATNRVTVVAQSPAAGARVPAHGVKVGRGYRPTTVALHLAAR